MSFSIWKALAAELQASPGATVIVAGRTLDFAGCIEETCKGVHSRTNESSLTEMLGLAISGLEDNKPSFVSFVPTQRWNLAETIFQLATHHAADAQCAVWTAAAEAWRRLLPAERKTLSKHNITQKRLWGHAIASSRDAPSIGVIFERMTDDERAEMPSDGSVKRKQDLAKQAAAMAAFGTLSEAKVHHCLRSGMTLPRIKLMMERLSGGSRLCSN